MPVLLGRVLSITLAGLAGMLMCRQPQAAALEIQPLSIEAPFGPFTTSLDVINRGGGETVLQVRALAWTQSQSGGDTLTQAPSIRISPPMFTLPEGETQTIRLVLHTDASDSEQAFRILVDEIPRREQGKVSMALRMSLPVFAGGTGHAAKLEWTAAPGNDGNVVLTAHNPGQRHVRVSNLQAVLPGRPASAAHLLDQNPYVLPGSDRHWSVAVPARVGDTAQLTADGDLGPIAASVVVAR